MSNRQTLKDSKFRAIAYIDTELSGRQVIKDKGFRTLGYYDPKQNVTTDAHHRRVGTGNLLTSLIPPNQY